MQHTDFLDLVNEETTPNGIRVVDMADLRMRAMDTLQLKFMSAWGVRGTQVAWEEVGQALQTGIVDGYLNPPTAALTYGHSRLLRYYTDLRIAGSGRAMAISEDWYQNLSGEEKATVDRGIAIAREANRRWNDKIMEVEFRMLRQAGVTVSAVSPEARGVWVQRTRAAYNDMLDPVIVQQMLNIVEQTK